MPTPRGPRLARKPKDQYHHGDLRRALLQAAVRTLHKHGLDALTLRAVGEELGVSRSALYRHFADKSALLTAVASEGFRMLRSELSAAWQGAGKGRAGFEAMASAYVRFAVQNPWHYRVMFGSGFELQHADPELVEEGTAAFGALVGALVEQQAQRLVRPDDPQTQAHFVWALVHGIAMLAIDGSLQHQGADVAALTRYAAERLRTGLALD
ncbi:MAG TPA: TetR/AcrR family transcriptional regulator [Polyangiaceae bacterium]|jgi:AcrR family transcriptional regulator|nr:TetR/AcrR family transcriptional regulator [Polyangiaceae bacterium]